MEGSTVQADEMFINRSYLKIIQIFSFRKKPDAKMLSFNMASVMISGFIERKEMNIY